jgi:threonine/homoserine/homoserine lactone efflux protein
MLDLQPILLAAVAGYICALIFASIPFGPINLTILNEGTQRGFRWAWLIGIGASVMDTIYCGISFTGLSQFFDHGVVKASMQVITFVFLLFLGAKFMASKVVRPPSRLNAAAEKIEARLEQRIHPNSAFMTGFVRVLGNLGVLLTYIVVAAYLMSNKALWSSEDWVQDYWPAKVACVCGVFLGTNSWFLGLSFAVSRGYGRCTDKTMLRMQQFSGLCLVFFALFGGAHIVWQLARHRL